MLGAVALLGILTLSAPRAMPAEIPGDPPDPVLVPAGGAIQMPMAEPCRADLLRLPPAHFLTQARQALAERTMGAPLPPSLRPEVLPVPALYRLPVSARKRLAASVLFSLHPLLTLAPTAAILDAPGDHPHPCVPGEWLASMPSEEGTGDNPIIGVPTSPPAAAGGTTCPFLHPPAEKEKTPVADNADLVPDVLTNLRRLTQARRLLDVAADLRADGCLGEALSCCQLARNLVPGSPLAAEAGDMMAAVVVQLFGAGETPKIGQEQHAVPEAHQSKATALFQQVRDEVESVHALVRSALTVERVTAFFRGMTMPTEAAATVEQRLTKPISLQLQDVPLKTALEKIADLAGVKIDVDRRGLEEAGISLDRPVNANLDEVSLKSVLNLLLRPYHLQCVPRDGALLITPEEWSPHGRPPVITDEDGPCPDAGAEASSVPPVHIEHSRRPKPSVEKVLGRAITLELTDTPLKQFADDLRNNLGINLYLDAVALQEAGISPERPLSAKLTDVRLKTALELLLQPMHLSYVVKDEVLQITSEKCARGNLVRAVYSVADLVADNEGADGNALRRVITSSIEPKTWNDMGGSGTIDYFPPKKALVINQTPDVQEQVVDLLAALHRLQDDEEKSDPAQDDEWWEPLFRLLKAIPLPFGRLINVYSSDPSAHTKQLPEESENLRQIEYEWEHIWLPDAPSHLTPERIPGGIQEPQSRREPAPTPTDLGVQVQVAGLIKACRLAVEAGNLSHAADLSRQVHALDPTRASTDRVVARMYRWGQPAPLPREGTSCQCPAAAVRP
jgi:hypothetical protein